MKKKNKKKSIFTKKQKIAIAVGGIILFLLILQIIMMPIKNESNEVITNTGMVEGISTIKDVVEYLDAQYISETTSNVDGYDIDIEVVFPYDLFDGTTSKEIYFKNFYEKIAQISNFKSFRLIDNARSITIEVKCSESKISEVKINGDLNYYKNENSKRSRDNKIELDELNLEINSPELQSLLNANWIISNAELGSIDSTFDKYDIYFEEGYKIRSIQGRVFNIVFTEKYDQNVVENLGPGANLEKVENYIGQTYSKSQLLLYKTSRYYIIFSNDEISVYPIRRYDYTDFENLVKEYNQKQDINDFIDKLTDIWPDYSEYTYSQTSVEITYAHKGVKISFNSKEKEGIQIYENYMGELISDSQNYTDVYFKLNENLFVEHMSNRIVNEMIDNYGREDGEVYENESRLFIAKYKLENNLMKNIKFHSITNNYPSTELDDTIAITSYYWINDYEFVYGVSGRGIYVYNVVTHTTDTLLTGNSNYEISEYNKETQILTYDNTQVKINN